MLGCNGCVVVVLFVRFAFWLCGWMVGLSLCVWLQFDALFVWVGLVCWVWGGLLGLFDLGARGRILLRVSLLLLFALLLLIAVNSVGL